MIFLCMITTSFAQVEAGKSFYLSGTTEDQGHCTILLEQIMTPIWISQDATITQGQPMPGAREIDYDTYKIQGVTIDPLTSAPVVVEVDANASELKAALSGRANSFEKSGPTSDGRDKQSISLAFSNGKPVSGTFESPSLKGINAQRFECDHLRQHKGD